MHARIFVLNLQSKVFKIPKTMTIIGIAGGSGSGKTTVVKRIIKALPSHSAAVVPLDSYYNDTTGLTPEERKQINFDHPDAFDWKLLTEQIKKLRNGEAIEQPTYSYIESNRQKETVHVDPKPVIIIEGIMALHNKKLRDMMDLKIFVDTDSVVMWWSVDVRWTWCSSITRQPSSPCMSSLSSLRRNLPTSLSPGAGIISADSIS